MVSEISSGLVVKNKTVLMVQEGNQWNFPSADGKSDELSADTAQRAVTNLTGCDAEVSRYRDHLKTTFDKNETEFTWQPYSIEINGKPEEGEWVPIDEIESMELPSHLEKVREKLIDRL